MASGTIQIITNGAERGVLPENTDFNSITAKGVYRFSGTFSHAPISNGILEVFGTEESSAVVQRVSDGSSSYYRYYTGSVWNDWRQFDHYIDFLSGSGTTHTISVPNNYRGILIAVATTANLNGMWMLACTSAGVVVKTDIKTASGITLATSTNTLTLTYGSATNIKYAVINITGELSMST